MPRGKKNPAVTLSPQNPYIVKAREWERVQDLIRQIEALDEEYKNMVLAHLKKLA